MRAGVPLSRHEVKTPRLSRRGDRLFIEETDLLEEPRAGGFRAETTLGDI